MTQTGKKPWFGKLARARTNFRPQLEILENRVTPAPAPPAPYIVTTNADNGAANLIHGSLRAAILAVDNGLTNGQIEFAIPAKQSTTITVKGNPLPSISQPVTISTLLNPGPVAGQTIYITGSDPSLALGKQQQTPVNGLTFIAGSGGSKVIGLDIREFTGNGILINGVGGITIGSSNGNGLDVLRANRGYGIQITGPKATTNVVINTFIGVESDGVTPMGNTKGGVLIDGGASFNTIGSTIGDLGPQLNVISGNEGPGVTIQQGGQNVICGNYIGPASTGLSALVPNLQQLGGVLIDNSSNNIIGMGIITERNVADTGANVIASINEYGIKITGKSKGNLLQGNFIGVNKTGNKALGPNLGRGVDIESDGNTVGGANASLGNVIADNADAGVYINANANSVQYNKIGVGFDGHTALGNKMAGIFFSVTSTLNTGRNNTIVNNTPGVDDRSVIWTIPLSGGNKIFDPNIFIGNSEGIEDGTEAGRPMLTSAAVSGGLLTIQGTLAAQPSSPFGIEVFGNQNSASSEQENGEVYLGTVYVVTDGSGNASFTLNTTNLMSGYITATATGMWPQGTTSEFSADIAITGTSITVSTPTVTSVSQTIGSTGGGLNVTVTGTNFTGVTGVFFGGGGAVSVTVNSSTSITAVAGPLTSGTYDVTVTNLAGTSALNSGDRYTYIAAPEPIVTSLGTSSGTTAGGTTVVVNGTGFTGTDEVLFGDVPATSFSVNSDNQLIAFSPAQYSGTVDVTVITPSGNSSVSSSDEFTYSNASTPTDSGLSLTSGSTNGSTGVTISGSYFTGAIGVSFGSVPASDFTVLSDGSITVNAPAQAAGTVDVTVTTFSGTSTTSSSDSFTYNAASSPTVTGLSVSGDSALGGIPVTIIGTNFTGATSVSFGSVATDFIVNSDTSITAYDPAQAAGAVNVTVSTYAATSTSTATFTYSAASLPAVSSLGTSTGTTAGGTVVQINGSGFTDADEVSFGSAPVFDFTVNSDTQITAVTPPNFAGTWDVQVVTPAGVSAPASGDQFSYTLASAPAVSSLGTSSGSTAGGTSVAITGADFTAATDVLFGGVEAASFVVNSSTSITAISPTEAAGTVDITVGTYSGTSAASSSDQFTFNAASAPTVTSLTSSSGTSAGGDFVGINGTNFTSATGVTFGGVAVDFTLISDTLITTYSPPKASSSTVDVQVTTFGGTSATSSNDQFTYFNSSSATVGGIDATTGTTAGGTTVNITGTHYTGATAVSFGSTPAASFTVNSDTSITAVTPMEGAGTVHTTVTTAAGTSSTSSADDFTYTNIGGSSAPTVTAVSPNTGSHSGGRSITVTGTHFTGAVSVSIGGGFPAAFTVNSDTSLTATVPSGFAGTVDVTVTTNNGTSATSGSDHFTYESAGAPFITSLGTSTGTSDGGTSMSMTGTNFTGATAVSFGSVGASTFTVNSSSSISATSPALPIGTYAVTVTTPSGTSAAATFTVTAGSAPTLTSLGTSTATTAGGNTVAITGTNFNNVTGVFFGGVGAASITINSPTSITATSPAQFAGTVDVTVAAYAGTTALSSSDRFAYSLASVPTVTSLGTSSGTTAGGTSVAITGTNFTAATGVFFGNVGAASFTINSSTSITATAPAQYAGTVDVIVATYAGTSVANSGDQFTYSNASAPTVTSLGTGSGTTAGGTSVTITGTNFTGTTGVSFGSVAAAFTVNSSSSITATAPPQTAATVDVTVTTYSATSATSSSDHFVYSNATTPSVSAVGPNSGSAAGGTVVTVTGSNFTGATGVAFGSVAADSFTILSDSTLLATAPAGAASTVDITVTTFAGTSSTGSSDHFTYSSVSAPTVSALSTSSGSSDGGTVVTITGTGFLNATGVNFGTTPAASFAIASDTSILATMPPMPAGVLDVSVTNYGGTSALNSSDRFTITAANAPAVTSLGTSSGTTAGGTSVMITGTDFTATDAVLFGGVAAASFTVNSDTSITAVSSSQASGTVDITVDTLTGTSAVSSSDHFTYSNASAPSVSSLSQTGGSTAGGTVVTVYGSYFTGATAVNFGSVAAGFTVMADGYLIATAPSQASGTVDVTVVTPSGTSTSSSADYFTYTAATTPAVSSLTPNSATIIGGDPITILGSNFTGATAVNFGSTVAVSFTVLSDNAILAIDPAESAGTVNVSVVTPSGTSSTSSSTCHFTYNSGSSPTVTSLGTSSGSTAGGTIVTITGTNFTDVTGVSFGSYAATYVFVNSSTQITAVSPTQAAATVDVTVTTGIATSATSSSDHFTYNAASSPTVTGVGPSPSGGSTAGGTTVIITGTNLGGVTAVTFGTVAATSFTINPDGTISAVSPAESAATIDITVTTVISTSVTGSADHFTYVAPPTLTAGSSLTVNPTHNVSFSGTLGGFTDSDTGGTASQFTTFIDWGNGQHTAGAIVANGFDGSGHPKFNITGSGGLYASAGTYTITILVIGPDGSTVTLTATATVAMANTEAEDGRFGQDDTSSQTVPDDPSREANQPTVVVRANEAGGDDDSTAAPTLDALLEGDGWSIEAIVSGSRGDGLNAASADMRLANNDRLPETHSIVNVTSTADQTDDARAERQSANAVPPNAIYISTKALPWVDDRADDLRRNDAFFIAIAEREQQSEGQLDNWLIESQEGDNPATSIWEDMAAAVRGIVADLSAIV